MTLPRGNIKRHERGFSLVELMAVLLIVAVLLVVGAPGFSTLIERTQLKSYANELVRSVYLARNEAIKRNSQMDICVVLDPTADPLTCGTSGKWEEGWIVLDPNEPSNSVVSFRQDFAPEVILFDLSNATFSKLSFDSTGLGSSSRTFKLCKTDGVEAKQISVSVTGRTRVETYPGCACDTVACP